MPGKTICPSARKAVGIKSTLHLVSTHIEKFLVYKKLASLFDAHVQTNFSFLLHHKMVLSQIIYSLSLCHGINDNVRNVLL